MPATFQGTILRSAGEPILDLKPPDGMTDAMQRDLLDETLIIWGGEVGRQPTAEYAAGTGRDHNAYGFTMWARRRRDQRRR